MGATWASSVLDLFVELAAIPSPSGEERAVAAVIRAYLADRGLAVEDDEAGNLLAGTRAGRGRRRRPIFLCAHMDTVPPVGEIQPVVGEDGFVRNGANTILGADNKATVAVLLEAARLLLSEGRPHAGVELLFTSRRRSASREPRTSTTRACSPSSASSTTAAAPWAGLSVRRRTGRPSTSCSRVAARTRGSHRRRAARPSSRPRAPSPTSGSAGSTRRRPPTWA